MHVEQLKPDRFEEVSRNSTICFNGRSDPEATKKDAAELAVLVSSGEREIWGAIDDETNSLMADMQLVNYRTRICDKWVNMVGIGGVNTLPQYRRSGAIRSLFNETLPHMYERGAVISALYPFSHEFYRKFGYQVICGVDTTTIDTAQLRVFEAPSSVRPIERATDMLAARVVYEQFSQRYNLSVRRHYDNQWKYVMGGDICTDGAHKYLIMRQGEHGEEACAYIKFIPRRDAASDEYTAVAHEAAYLDGDALRRLLSFMAGFDPHYKYLKLSLPTDVELSAICPRPYNISHDFSHSYMVRAINVKALTESLKPAAYAAQLKGGFTMKISDSFIRHNDSGFDVYLDNGRVSCLPKPLLTADIEADIGAFSQIATGALSLEQAAWYGALKLNRHTAVTDALFTRRPIYVQDKF